MDFDVVEKDEYMIHMVTVALDCIPSTGPSPSRVRLAGVCQCSHAETT
jgi:hypothetical protein